MRAPILLSLLASAMLSASCSPRTLFEPAPPRPFEVPAHLDRPMPEPVVVVEEVRTRGDKDRLLGDYVTWGRELFAQYTELRRLLDVFNRQEKATP